MTSRVTPSFSEPRHAHSIRPSPPPPPMSPTATVTEGILALDTRLSTIHLRLTNDRTMRTFLGNLPNQVGKSTLAKFRKARLRRGVRLALKVEHLLAGELKKLQASLGEDVQVEKEVWRTMEQIEGESMEVGAREVLECERELSDIGEGDESLQRVKEGVGGILRLVKDELMGKGGNEKVQAIVEKVENKEKVREWKKVPSAIIDEDDRFARTPSEYSDDDDEEGHPVGTWCSDGDEKEKEKEKETKKESVVSKQQQQQPQKEHDVISQPKPYPQQVPQAVNPPKSQPSVVTQAPHTHAFPQGQPPHSHAPVIDATREYIADPSAHPNSTPYPPQTYTMQPPPPRPRPTMMTPSYQPANQVYTAEPKPPMHTSVPHYAPHHPPPHGYPGTAPPKPSPSYPIMADSHRLPPPPPGYPGSESRKSYPNYQADGGIFQRQYPHAERQAAERAYTQRAYATSYSQQQHRGYPSYPVTPVDARYTPTYDPYAQARSGAYATTHYGAERYTPPYTYPRSAPHVMVHSHSRSAPGPISQPVPLPHSVPHVTAAPHTEHHPRAASHIMSHPAPLPETMPHAGPVSVVPYSGQVGPQRPSLVEDFARLTEMYHKAESTVKTMQQLAQRQQMETAHMTAQLSAQAKEYQQQSAQVLAQIDAQVSHPDTDGYRDMVDAFGNLHSR